MKYLLNDIDKRLIERISNITLTQTGIDNEGYIEIDTLLYHLDALEDFYNHELEEKEKLENDIRENYIPKKRNYYYEYGINENDFH